MSDELNSNPDALQISAQTAPDEEYEEISSDEVDRVVEALELLMDTLESENIQAYLEEASHNIFALVYDEEDCDTIQDEAA